MTDVLILGGGIAGLAAGFRLGQQGFRVEVLEASPQLGGLGTTFEWEGRAFEKFYHTTTSTDTALMELVADAHMRDQYDMHITKMAMTVGGVNYPFNTPVDLLRFTPLSLPNRIRFGAGGVSLRVLGKGKDLDNLTAEQWLRPILGNAAWERIVAPMFGMKFGGHMPPALYLYERLAREKNVAKRAYPKIGYRGIADGLGAAIEAQGGRVHTSTPVLGLESDGHKVVATIQHGQRSEQIDAPWAISTLPIPQLKHIAGRTRAHHGNGSVLAGPVSALPDIGYMGVINVLFITSEAPTGFYWAFVTESDTQFEGRIEMSTLTGTEHFHGNHGTYVMKYLDRRDPLFAESDEAIRARWTEQFLQVHPHLRDKVEHAFVFRTPFVEPVWPLGYKAIRPAPQVGDTPLFLATTAQSYPMVTSWNSATVVAQRTVADLLQVM